MALQATSRAAAVGASVNNVVFQASAENVPHKGSIIGTYDPAKTAVVDEVPVLITSAADAGNRFGFGTMLHRLCLKWELGSDGVEMWAIPQTETSAASAGDVTFAGASTEAGSIYLYIAGERTEIPVASGVTAIVLSGTVADYVNADQDLPTSAVGALGVVDLTAKSEGEHWGDSISIYLNLGDDEALPAGITAVITDMTGGAGTPTILDALNGMGTGDNQNEKNFTELVQGYGDATAVLDVISTYNGTGNLFEGNYAKLVSRPFRALTGDVTNTLSTLVTAANLRKLDRTNGQICAPLSPNHPSEIAATALGIMAKINNDRAAQSYIGVTLSGVITTDGTAARWADSYDSRDTAVKVGISPTKIEDGVLKLQNVMTYYHPDAVPVTSNGYASQRNISILQNVLFNVRQTFSTSKWQGISIVADVTKVSSTIDRQKARDIDAVLDDLLVLATAFEGKAWIYTAAFTAERLASGGYVTIRGGGIGFDATLPILLSGEGGIIDTVVEFDTSLAVLLG